TSPWLSLASTQDLLPATGQVDRVACIPRKPDAQAPSLMEGRLAPGKGCAGSSMHLLLPSLSVQCKPFADLTVLEVGPNEQLRHHRRRFPFFGVAAPTGTSSLLKPGKAVTVDIDPHVLLCLLAVRQLGGQSVPAKQDVFTKGLKAPLKTAQEKGWLRL